MLEEVVHDFFALVKLRFGLGKGLKVTSWRRKGGREVAFTCACNPEELHRRN